MATSSDHTPGATQEPRSEGGEREQVAKLLNEFRDKDSDFHVPWRELNAHWQEEYLKRADRIIAALRATPSVQPPASLDREALQRAKDAIEWIVPQYRNTLAGRGVRNVYETFVECEFALKAIARAVATGETPRCSLHSTFQAFCPQCERETKCLDALDGETPEMGREPSLRGPTDAEIDDACMWYRQDFGLLHPEDQRVAREEAREWLRAWCKVRDFLPPSAPVERQERHLANVRDRLFEWAKEGRIPPEEAHWMIATLDDAEPREREGEGLEEQMRAKVSEILERSRDLYFNSGIHRASHISHLARDLLRLLSSAPQGDRERLWEIIRDAVWHGRQHPDEVDGDLATAGCNRFFGSRALAPSVPSKEEPSLVANAASLEGKLGGLAAEQKEEPHAHGDAANTSPESVKSEAES